MDCKKCGCHFIITWLICEEDPKTIHCPNCGRPLTKPEPLSIEQLRGMDGCPIWVESAMPLINQFHPHWEVVEMVVDDMVYISGRGPREFRTYGVTWVAYATKPEREGEI